MVYWERLDTRKPNAQWERLDQSCLYPGKPPQRPGDVVIAVTEKQLRELPIVAPKLGTQPGRHTLKGAETNIYADPAEQSFSITILGRKVDIKVTPSEYRWDYGDGTTLVTRYPGGPVPEERWGEKTVTSHIYTATGDFTVGLTTVFTGEFSVDGGPYQPIAGTAEIPSAPRTLSVWRSEVKLYADNCNVNPEGAGC
ncbi:PKD domain-containing protein [Sinomonas halotolerans]|uniref:PKD domain-containing protein n=1 Tax=Sinomonas halotolerans TaxID=1644133 RepID=A0ABU9WYF8_9MICC